jgi:hypothetical protein
MKDIFPHPIIPKVLNIIIFQPLYIYIHFNFNALFLFLKLILVSLELQRNQNFSLKDGSHEL